MTPLAPTSATMPVVAPAAAPIDATTSSLAALIDQLSVATAQLSAAITAIPQAGAAAVQGGGSSPTGCSCGATGMSTAAVAGIAQEPPTGTAPSMPDQAPDQAPTPTPPPAPEPAAATPAPPPPPAAATPAGLPPKDSRSEQEIRDYIKVAAKAYGADAGVLDKIAEKESTYDARRRQTGETVVNNWDSNATAGHPSEGLMQFIPDTFTTFSTKAKAANPQAWEGLGDFDIKDFRQQALTTSWAITHGYGSHWATYKAAGGQ